MQYFTTSTHGRVITPQKHTLPPKASNRYRVVDSIYENEDAVELAWLNHLMHETPNGRLYFDNDTRTILDQNDELIVVHATLSLEAIKRSGKIYPSVGCLGVAIFGVPLARDGTLHNFSQYIFDHEIPMVQKIKNLPIKQPGLIGIRLRRLAPTAKQFYGFHYLHLGGVQFDAYQRVAARYAAKKDSQYFALINDRVTTQIREATAFLNRCYQYDFSNDETFFAEWQEALAALPFLGYLYFEVISEYIQLYQQDSESQALAAKGQLNIRHFKDLIYALEPRLSAGFDLEKLQPSIDQVINQIKTLNTQRELLSTFDTTVFLHFMKWRLAQYVRLRALGGQPIDPQTPFGNTALAGHIIHRLIGEMPEMKPYLWEYDMERAKVVWRDWELNNIAFVENAVMPRGEIGVNPHIPVDSYEIYELIVDPATKEIIDRKKLDVTIEPHLANDSLMGSSNNPKGTAP